MVGGFCLFPVELLSIKAYLKSADFRKYCWICGELTAGRVQGEQYTYKSVLLENIENSRLPIESEIIIRAVDEVTDHFM